MARARNPKRDEALQIYLESQGKIKLKDLAEQVGVPDLRIRKWKSEDKWAEKIKERSDSDKGTFLLDNRNVPIEKPEKEKKKPGGQQGNHNARGHGAPKGNQNAVGNNGGAPPENQNARTHGYYSKFIPVDELDILLDAPGAGNLDKDLKFARYKLNSLIKCQRDSLLYGIGFGAMGAENYKLQDDFYENMIQKQLKVIADLEYKISRIKQITGSEEEEALNITIKRKEKQT